MREINGIWLPDHEQHLQDFAKLGAYGRWTYQFHKLEAALRYVRRAHLAVDVGGHCGLWSKELVKLFDKVVAFEPVMEHRQCWTRNIHRAQQVMCDVEAGESPAEILKAFDGERHVAILCGCALGEADGMVSIHTTQGQSGDSWVDGEGDIPLTTLDSFDLEGVDFIKLDCEGYELFALRGGEKMLKRDKPVVIVEQKPGRGAKFGLSDTAAVDYLIGLGYELKKVISGDYILA